MINSNYPEEKDPDNTLEQLKTKPKNKPKITPKKHNYIVNQLLVNHQRNVVGHK